MLGRGVAVLVHCHVGHDCGTHREEISRVVVGSQGQITTVVGGGRIGPGHDRSALTGVAVADKVAGNTGENRILIVGDGDLEGLRVAVSGGIGRCQSHRRGSNGEEISAVVAALKVGNLTVVEGVSSIPHDDRATGTGIVRLGNVGRNVDDLRKLLVLNSHDEALAAGVAVDIGHGVGHRGFTDRQHRSALDTGNQTVDGTVVRHVRSCPGSGSKTDSRLGSHGDAIRKIGDHRKLEVFHGDQNRILGHVAVDVGQGEGYFSGTHIEVLSRLTIRDNTRHTTVV